MERIPITGFLVQSSDHHNEHSHKIYITSWDGRPIYHVHEFNGTTSFDDGHQHQYAGVTEPAPTGVPHIHHYHTITTINNEHTHTIEGTTGPAIDLMGGGHIHYFEGFTTVNGRNPHRHHYNGTTGNEV